MSAHQDLGGNGTGRWLGRLLGFLVIVALLAAAGYGSTRLFSNLREEPKIAALTHPVARGELLVTVTEDGNLQSAVNVDVKCQVAGGSAILWIVPDGQEVQKGEKLVELDASALDDQINQQKITVEKARSTMVQAEKDYSVAQIAVKEYLEGTYQQELQTKQAQITISLENLRTAENSLQHAQRMFRKGYISLLELESQQFSVQRAKLELDSANTAKDVLEKFTKVKTLEDLESKVATAKAKLESEKAAFALEEGKLKRLEAQRGLCTITAPQSGMVVYANEQGGRFGGTPSVTIEEGANVRERQTILRLPDLSQMEVKVKVHESKVESVTRGMRARIRILDRELQGTVTSVSNQPEPTSMFSANVKEYGTIVRIDGQPGGLKPGMTAEVEILVAYLQDVLTLPVASIVEQRGSYCCWVSAGGKTEKRPLVLGVSNDQFVEVKDGVREGDQVLLNPRAVLAEARQESVELEKVDVGKKFGDAEKPAPADSGKASPGGTPPPAGDGQPRGPGAIAGPGSAGPGSAGPGSAGPGGGSGGPGGGPGAPGAGPNGPGGGRGGMDLMSNDKDGDGKISKDEAPSFLQNSFESVDTNQDGFLDKAELDALRSRRGGGGAGGGGGGGGMRNLMTFDKDGDGKVSKDEAPEFMQNFFDRLDGNGDGVLDKAEIDAMRQRFQGGGGGGGPGGGFGGPPGS